MILSYRRIFKSQQTGIATTKELLQTMFVGELLSSGSDVWIVSPWISNIVLIDNRTGNFDSLNPEWSRREIRLIDVLLSLMARGSKVFIVTRDVESNTSFLNDIASASEMGFLESHLNVMIRDELHTKGILFSKSLLMGSMNITYNGLEMNDEMIQFCIDPADVADTRLHFEKYLG